MQYWKRSVVEQHEQGFRFNPQHHKNKQNDRTRGVAQW